MATVQRAAPFLCFSGQAPTTGDVAIGQSLIDGLKRHTGLPVRVRTNRPDLFAALPGLDGLDDVQPPLPRLELPPLRSMAFPLRLRALLRDLRRTGGAGTLPGGTHAALRDALTGCAGLVFQGGPAWNDWIAGRRQAADRWLLLEAARYYRTPAFHVGVSCGPFAWPYPRGMWMAPLVRRALDGHDMLFVRDSFSRPALQRLGVRAPVLESTDAAVFLHSHDDPAFAHVTARIEAAAPRRRVVVCVRDFQPAYPRAVQARDGGLAALARALDHVQREWADVFFLSTDHNPGPEKATDVAIARRVQQQMRVAGSSVIDVDVRHPAALKHIYGRFDAMISMRLHPTILALDHGVPCLLISYDAKCDDFFGRLGLQQYAVPLDSIDDKAIIAAVGGMLRRPDLRDDIRTRFARLKAAHAGDYAPMYARIAARAHEIATTVGAGAAP